MTRENLRELLSHVHERLARADKMDPESRELLTALTREIESALGGGYELASAEGHPVHRLEGLAVQFEAEHPGLAGVLRQLIDALGKAGI